MNFKLSTIAVATALTLGASVSLADAASLLEGYHSYVGAGLGYGEVMTGFKKGDKQGEMKGLKQTGFAYNVNVGHLYHVDNMALGAELGFAGYPDVSSTPYEHVKATMKAKSIDVLAVGKYYFTPEVNITAKAGIAAMMQSVKTKNNANDVELDEIKRTHVVPVLGFGVGYNVMENVTLNVDYKYSFGRKMADKKTTPNTLLSNPTYTVLAGVTYTF